MATQQLSPAQIAQMNLDNRRALIAGGLAFTKQLQPVTSDAMAQTMRINLERAGILTGVTLEVSIPVNVTAAATQSPFGPYNVFSSVKYTDFASVERVSLQGWQLHAVNCVRGAKFLNNAQKMDGYLAGTETGVDTNLLNLPTAVAADTIKFSLYVPLAYDPATDLRGAVLAQTITGDHYITLRLADALVAADTLTAPYSAGTVALNGNVTVTA